MTARKPDALAKKTPAPRASSATPKPKAPAKTSADYAVRADTLMGGQSMVGVLRYAARANAEVVVHAHGHTTPIHGTVVSVTPHQALVSAANHYHVVATSQVVSIGFRTLAHAASAIAAED